MQNRLGFKEFKITSYRHFNNETALQTVQNVLKHYPSHNVPTLLNFPQIEKNSQPGITGLINETLVFLLNSVPAVLPDRPVNKEQDKPTAVSSTAYIFCDQVVVHVAASVMF